MQRKPSTARVSAPGGRLVMDRTRAAGRRGTARRRGVAAVEMAIILPFLMLLTVGLMQFAMIFLVRHGMLHACREGARAYAKQNITAADAVTRTQTMLVELFSAGYAADFTVASSTAGADRIITVTIPSSTSWVSFADIFGFLDSYPTITSTVKFRDEGNY